MWWWSCGAITWSCLCCHLLVMINSGARCGNQKYRIENSNSKTTNGMDEVTNGNMTVAMTTSWQPCRYHARLRFHGEGDKLFAKNRCYISSVLTSILHDWYVIGQSHTDTWLVSTVLICDWSVPYWWVICQYHTDTWLVSPVLIHDSSVP